MEGVQNRKAVFHVKNRFSISNMSGDRGKYSRAKGAYLIVHQLRAHSLHVYITQLLILFCFYINYS